MTLRGQGSTVIVLNKMAVILRKFGFSILSSDPFLDFLDRTSLIYLIYLYRFDESKDIFYFFKYGNVYRYEFWKLSRESKTFCFVLRVENA